MYMKILFKGQVPKESSFPECNEDAFELTTSLGRIAVSDGASESFDSKTWAQLLVSRFVEDTQLTEEWLNKAIVDYVGQFDPVQMSWSKQAAFQKGSFATLLGIQYSAERGTIDVLAVGDSIAVLLDGGDFIDSFPYVQANEFSQRPELLSTSNRYNGFIERLEFSCQHHKTWSIQERHAPIILCMTDALGEWALRNAEEGHSTWNDLIQITEASGLATLVFQEREAKRMRVDDTTLIVIVFQAEATNALPDARTIQ